MEHRVTVLLRQVDRPNQLDGCHEHESDLLLGRQFWGSLVHCAPLYCGARSARLRLERRNIDCLEHTISATVPVCYRFTYSEKPKPTQGRQLAAL